MPHDAAPTSAGPTKLVIRNVGLMLSGRMEQPILEADCLIAENGKITGMRPRKGYGSPRARRLRSTRWARRSAPG